MFANASLLAFCRIEVTRKMDPTINDEKSNLLWIPLSPGVRTSAVRAPGAVAELVIAAATLPELLLVCFANYVASPGPDLAILDPGASIRFSFDSKTASAPVWSAFFYWLIEGVSCTFDPR